MKFLRNLKLDVRLGLGFGVMMVIVVMTAAVGVLAVNQVRGGQQTVYKDRVLALQALSEINRLMLRNRALVVGMANGPEAGIVEKDDLELRANVERITKRWEDYSATSQTPEEKTLAASFAVARSSYVKHGLLRTRDALRAGDRAEAGRTHLERIGERAAVAQSALDKLIQFQSDAAAEEYAAAERTAERAVAVALAAAALALLLSALLVRGVSRSITRPLAQAIGVAGRIREATWRRLCWFSRATRSAACSVRCAR